ncbi:MAG: NADH-quinone oxidoreductase subunit L [Acidobacteriota bacterium]|nr:NADH-quinone oxidoreductase subunit L [Blastocatellia bacterium]MDW8412760.1 NADH-quinone oxidoreductase subunit L [Acidobacteriota bacterium]
MLSVIVFAPLVGAIVLGLFGRRLTEKIIAVIACSSVLVSTLAAFYAFWRLLSVKPAEDGVRRINETLFTWIAAGSFSVDFGFLLDPLSGVMILFVTGVGFLIHVFATGYMHGDSGFYRFFAYMNLFMFMMLVLVLGDNFLMMFVGWEGVGLCSYLLIGYYFLEKFAGDAAKKAFVVNRIGDFGLALGVMLIFLKFGNVSFVDKANMVSALSQAAKMPVEPFSGSILFAGGLTTIAALLFIGATGKSAQIPLFVWLPDAMAGPTPVSALIHAATMVTAGVYMIARTNAIFAKAPLALTIVAIVGALTAVVAATIGLAQWDIKKVLAYSTVSQLGYMFLACGAGAFAAGFFHVVTHAFFKALLFLGSGSVIHAMHHEQDMRRMGGLQKYLKTTFITMAIGTLAISGFPLLSGFFSKDEILWKVRSSPVLPGSLGTLLWLIGLATAAVTAIYMTRMMVVTFLGEERFRKASDTHGEHHEHEPHESPPVMTVPLVVLAFLSVVGGFVGIPEALAEKIVPHSLHGVTHSFYHFLDPVFIKLSTTPGNLTGALAADHGAELVSTLLSTLVALIAIGVGYAVFSKQPLLTMPKILENKYYVDELYDAVIVNPVKWTSKWILWKVMDVGIVDGTVNGLARLLGWFSIGIREFQVGFTRAYAIFLLIGALTVVGYFLYFGRL